ncbi:tautomerase family protein [Frigoribacterium sp. CFBP 8759]|uniref:tautomerase family protein n=1 Tax=unclassified Frigoribacterium TaxID=2627005 RepID=UPI0006F66126|nr:MULTISPECIES: tautomerase family protein [unclassified Frigoribacterium]KQM29696.1 tautomerase [Frigoribacterium sp. Leaf8]MBD8139395.1 tautomerase family protein [Frigoribacterium sp. CFBP 13605]MBD8487032.1 tautomerase family protein [Frigoribacterium sp. CFBP 8759]NQW87472.1 tautomerase family protein [Frigoribacterium sp. VKM Ac-2860]NQX09719.1 tautomerase family protein [Frigoribacterium sp. VKM Ac-2859]
MPLVRIDLLPGRSPDQITAIADAVHDAIVDVYGIPPRDRFQVINELPAGRIIAQDAGLGFERSGGVVMIQIFTQRGRTDDAKQALYARIASGLEAVGVAGEDVFIGYVENGPQDWSFGFGVAQYVTGELTVPSAAGQAG